MCIFNKVRKEVCTLKIAKIWLMLINVEKLSKINSLGSIGIEPR